MFRKLLVLLALIFTTSIYSQMSFGIKGGLNFSNAVYNIESASPEGRVGFYAGTFVDLELSEKFHFQPEILYSSEGVKDGSVDFLNVPVTLKWYFFDGIHLQAGPQVGMVIDAEGGTNGLKTLNLAGVGGLGYETHGGFVINARFSHGITSIIDEGIRVDSGMGYTISGIKGWTKAFQLGIGYKF